MSDFIYGEFHLLGICILLGMILAGVYDLIRIFRMFVFHKQIIIDLEDLTFWILTTWFVFKTLFQYNQGVLRGYVFLGLLIGVFVYMATISRLVMKVANVLLPIWKRGKRWLKKPLNTIKDIFRKTLKNICIEVKMAIKSR